jgi:peptidoglycan/LPS O-acetylase OafA/YrhL
VVTPATLLVAFNAKLHGSFRAFQARSLGVSRHFKLGMSSRPFDALFWGVILVVVGLAMLACVRSFAIDKASRPAQAIRFIAEGTFPIYLLHFPLLVLIGAAIPYNHASSVAKVVIVLTVAILGILTGPPLNYLKKALRVLFQQAHAAGSKLGAQQPLNAPAAQ